MRRAGPLAVALVVLLPVRLAAACPACALGRGRGGGGAWALLWIPLVVAALAALAMWRAWRRGAP